MVPERRFYGLFRRIVAIYARCEPFGKRGLRPFPIFRGPSALIARSFGALVRL